MVVTLSVAELSAALRLTDSAEETAEATRLLAYASEAVIQYAPDAVDTAHTEACVRLASYIYDQPTAGRGDSYANALRNSGAARMLLPYRIHRAGYSDAVASAQQAVGTVGNPVTGVDVTGTTLTVTFADGTTETHALPDGVDQTARDAAEAAQTDIDDHEANHPSGGTVDQTARDSAAAAKATADGAQTTADSAQSDATDAGVAATANTATQTAHAADTNAHHVPTTASGEAVVESARLPVGTVVMRVGWAQTQTPLESFFTRANLHPTDGAAEGTVAGLNPPPFPPSVNTDPDLYLFIWIATAAENIADIRLSGGGGTLIGSVSHGAAFEYDGTDGTVYVSNQRLSPGLSAYQISAIVGGELIASQPWVTEQIEAIPAPEPSGGGAPVLIGSATVPAGQSPFTLRLPNATADTFFAAYNAGTYPGGYRIDLTWAVSNAQHALAAVLPPELWATMTDGISYTLHLDAGAALDSTTSRYVQFSRTALQDFVEIASLPVSDDFDAGTTFRVYGLP